MLTFDDFSIDLLTFELRFDNAYLMWDRVGTYWTRLQATIPDLKLLSVQPNQQTMETKDAQIVLDLGLLRVSTRGPKAFALMTDYSQLVYQTGCDLLELSTFTRVGYRSVRTKVYKDKSLALAEVASFGPKMSCHALGDNAHEVSFNLTGRFENDSSGLNATLKVEQREVKINVPWEALPHLENFTKNETVAYLDADFYTIGTTSRDALSADIWLRQADKLVKRHWIGFFS